MELASYRSSDGHSTDGESTSRNRKYIQGRTLPVYLLQDGPLPGIPRGKKIQKKAQKKNQTNKSYVPIDTTRTDFSKLTSDLPLMLDTTRTDETALNMSAGLATPQDVDFPSRPTPTTNYDIETPRDLPDFVFNSVRDINKNIISPQRNMTQSEMAHSHTKTVGKDSGGWKIRRKSHSRNEDGKTTESAPPSGRANRRSSSQSESRSENHPVKRSLENLDYEPNPDVAPYQPANFMSSTILKKVPIPKRHLDTFGGYEYNFMGKRGVMLHTDRYQVDFIKSFDGMTQRERLQAGMKYVEAMRGTKRRRELVPHRAQLDLIMGGKQIEFEERFLLARELQKLKALAMPDLAKDLYHGRGIHLPINHNSLKPRYTMPNDIAEEALASAPSSLQTVFRKDGAQTDFPRRDGAPIFMGKGSQMRARSNLNRHAQLPSIRGRQENGISREVTSLSRSNTQAPSYDDGEDQSQRIITKGRSGPSTQRKVSPTVDVPIKDNPKLSENVNEKLDTKPFPDSTHAPIEQETTHSLKEHETDVAGVADDGVISSDPAAEKIISSAPPIEPKSDITGKRPNTEEGLNRTTPNPLRGGDLINSVSQDEQEELRQTFQRLDTDMDGHIRYNQLKTQLPKAFSGDQERFIEEVYNLTNSITFFGVDEFMAMDRLTKAVENLSGRAKDAYESLDFSSIPNHLLKYVGKFDTADTGNHSTVTIESLQKILSETVNSSLTTDLALWDEVLDTISVDYGAKITKISFIAHIPLFLTLEKNYK